MILLKKCYDYNISAVCMYIFLLKVTWNRRHHGNCMDSCRRCGSQDVLIYKSVLPPLSPNKMDSICQYWVLSERIPQGRFFLPSKRTWRHDNQSHCCRELPAWDKRRWGTAAWLDPFWSGMKAVCLLWLEVRNCKQLCENEARIHLVTLSPETVAKYVLRAKVGPWTERLKLSLAPRVRGGRLPRAPRVM